METGVLLFCISVWDRYLNFRSVQNLSMFILLSLYNKVEKLTLCSKQQKLLENLEAIAFCYTFAV